MKPSSPEEASCNASIIVIDSKVAIRVDADAPIAVFDVEVRILDQWNLFEVMR